MHYSHVFMKNAVAFTGMFIFSYGMRMHKTYITFHFQVGHKKISACLIDSNIDSACWMVGKAEASNGCFSFFQL